MFQLSDPAIQEIFIHKFMAHENYRKQFLAFKKQFDQNPREFIIDWEERFPCLDDSTQGLGFEPHYTYHTAWAARILAENRPRCHVDISSALYFATIVSAFIPVQYYEFRPPNIKLSGLNAQSIDLQQLPFEDNSVDSLSCMHVVEHLGLGRYGDSLNSDADLQAIQELKRVLAHNGSLLFVVPIGKARIQYNAHRIYSYEQIVGYFSELSLREFSLIPDNALQTGMIRDATRQDCDLQSWGCGCFWFVKNESRS
ncbi:MAG: DUF268 domain-containing protein [Veillonellaceae bacterium]|nr:DUF268 domain-containing protein [Veillonellaceae bacterium]